jgi:hypothetical protein
VVGCVRLCLADVFKKRLHKKEGEEGFLWLGLHSSAEDPYDSRAQSHIYLLLLPLFISLLLLWVTRSPLLESAPPAWGIYKQGRPSLIFYILKSTKNLFFFPASMAIEVMGDAVSAFVLLSRFQFKRVSWKRSKQYTHSSHRFHRENALRWKC